MATVPKRNIVNDVEKKITLRRGKSHFGKSSSDCPSKIDIGTKLHKKENQTDGKLVKKEDSVESAPKSRNKIEWDSLSQKLKAIFGPRPARTWFHFDDDSLSEDSDDCDDEETEEPVEKRPRGTAKCSKNCGM
ncbi:uncharacterized protein [Montipora foliosa]|uniref:uncharacterized protein isoform X2 n=1 Tax=Montipora foliosa TaxID=591990 RepID=UPI0035F1EA7E